METRFDGLPVGQYAIKRYNELKKVVMEKGTPTVPTDRFETSAPIDLPKNWKITRGAVDNNPRTDDSISTMREIAKPEANVVEKVTMENFKETSAGTRTILTFNYMEQLSYINGERMISEMVEHYNSKTGEKYYPSAD